MKKKIDSGAEQWKKFIIFDEMNLQSESEGSALLMRSIQVDFGMVSFPVNGIQ